MRKTAFLLTIGGGVALATAWWILAQQESAAAKPPKPVSHRVDFLESDAATGEPYRIRSDGADVCAADGGGWDYWSWDPLDQECGLEGSVWTPGESGAFSTWADGAAQRALVFDWTGYSDVPDLDCELYDSNPSCEDCVPWECDDHPIDIDWLNVRFHGGKPGLFHKKATRYPLYIDFLGPKAPGGEPWTWKVWYSVEFVEAPYVVRVDGDADARILTTKNPDTGLHDAALVNLVDYQDGNPGTVIGQYELPFEAIFKLVYH